jgi:hypothetical protein
LYNEEFCNCIPIGSETEIESLWRKKLPAGADLANVFNPSLTPQNRDDVSAYIWDIDISQIFFQARFTDSERTVTYCTVLFGKVCK